MRCPICRKSWERLSSEIRKNCTPLCNEAGVEIGLECSNCGCEVFDETMVDTVTEWQNHTYGECSECGGSGEVWRNGIEIYEGRYYQCERCGGSGLTITGPQD